MAKNNATPNPSNATKPTLTVELVQPKRPPVSSEYATKVHDKLIIARVGMLLNTPFFGTLATRLTLTPADDMPTAATDGRRFYYNHDFVNKLTPEELIFLVGHEVMHCVYDHMGRRGDRDPKLWNIAADYAINLDLVDQKIGKLITTVPALYDTQYRGLSADEIYEQLEERFKNQTEKDKAEIQKMLDQMFDQHIDPNAPGNQPGDQEGNSQGGYTPMSPEERQQARDEFREAVINAAKNTSAGDLPAGVRRMIQDLTDPRMNWRELLRVTLASTQVSDFTWMKPSRLGWDLEAILPGTVEDGLLKIAVSIDTSGSISFEQARDFLSEVKGIMEQFNSYEIDVWCFDGAVHNPQRFTSDNLEDICNYEVKGGGGTSFQANWDYMKSVDLVPERFICFTDGYTGDGWGDPDYCETLWIFHNTQKDMVAPYGMSCHYDEN